MGQPCSGRLGQAVIFMGTELKDQMDRERWEKHVALKRWLHSQPITHEQAVKKEVKK